MLFNSFPFFFLVLITFSLYYLKEFKKYQVYILIISSAIFYGYSQPALLILLFISASINAITSYIAFFDESTKRKKIAIVGVIFNLLILAFFKYNKLLDGVQYGALSGVNDAVDFLVTLPLPIGISFYTFQGISLVMDVYNPLKKEDVRLNRNFLEHYKKTVFFIAFFPQLVAGPIVKAHDFFPQIVRKSIQDVDFYYVFKTLILGYFLKSVIADNLKDQTYWIFAPYFETQSSFTLVTLLFGYSMQIFSDFAGYSLIAIGVAALFGYKLPQNFNFPYISSSLSEFWTRWHISLSSWLKEYLYIILLGGNRKGDLRTYINLIVVMFLGGLWHGAAWSYGIWGLWHGIGLAIERKISNNKIQNELNQLLKIIRIFFVFSFVSFGWLLFQLTDIREAIQYIFSIKNNINYSHNTLVIINIVVYSFPVIVYHLFYLLKNMNLNPIDDLFFKYDYIIYSLMLISIFVNGGIPGDFVYFQF